MKIRVEYEPKQIRYYAVQCPHCERWFDGEEVERETYDRVRTDDDLYFVQWLCPICGEVFGADEEHLYSNIAVEECVSSSSVYRDCLRKKIKWE